MSYIGNQPSSVAFLTDTFSGDGSDTSFTLSAAPATTSSIIVAVSGVLQDPSTYAVTGTTLNFSAAPPSGTGNISVRFLGIPASGVTTTAYRTVTEFTATAAQTTFTPPSYTVGFINVYRNGVLLGSADYTATNGTTVVLAVGATSGDLVTVESFNVSSVLNAIPATAGSVGTSYLVDGSVTAAKLASGAALSNLGSSQLADANMPAGSVLQVVSTTKTDTFSTTSTSLTDVTGLSLSITPSNAANKILITCAVSVGTPNTNFAYINLLRNSTSLCVGDASAGRPSATGMSFAGVSNEGNITTLPINFLDSPSTTSATTYKIQIRCATAGNAYINRSSRDSASTDYDVRLASTITAMEIAG